MKEEHPGALYELVGVDPRASAAEIEAACVRAAIENHPGLAAGDPEAADRFRRIEEAFEILGDPAKRADYDCGRPLPVEEPPPPTPAAVTAAVERSVEIGLMAGAVAGIVAMAALFVVDFTYKGKADLPPGYMLRSVASPQQG